MASDILIIDYGIGNLFSVEKALVSLGASPKVSTNPADLKNASRVILPGVGAFDACAARLKERGFLDSVREYYTLQRPLLGICVGMQLLFDQSEEGKGAKGLGFIEGTVKAIPTEHNGKNIKVPNIGWRTINADKNSQLLKGVAPEEEFYFVHSYHGVPTDKTVRSYYSSYEEIPVLSLIEKDNRLFGCQFHPEKSRTAGLAVLKNFLTV